MFFFIDESGHPHPNDSAERPVIVAVGVPVLRSRELARRIFSLKRSVLNETDPWLEEKYKAHAIFNKRTYENAKLKWEYLEGVFELAVNFPVVTFAVVMERPSSVPEANPSMLPYHWMCILQRINAYHLRNLAESRAALLVMDSQQSKADTMLSVQISNFLFRSQIGKTLTAIVETPLFVDSKITPGIQIADYFASCLRQYHELGQREPDGFTVYERAVQRLYRSLKHTVYDEMGADGTKWYGEYFLPASRLEQDLREVTTEAEAQDLDSMPSSEPGGLPPEEAGGELAAPEA